MTSGAVGYLGLDGVRHEVNHGARGAAREHARKRKAAVRWIEGKVTMKAGVVFEGEVKVVNAGAKAAKLAAGTYKDQTVTVEARSSSMLSLS